MASFIILSGAILLTPPAKAELREFKTPDGKSVMAEIVGYNAKLGKVELKRENGKRVKVKPSVFVEEDQQYITDW
ncbi:MAG: hypothetical protein HKP10_08440, partial [Kiritimatiellales bacterium]|nr:hypothetical protein [Kiritimatiellales bacterium]